MFRFRELCNVEEVKRLIVACTEPTRTIVLLATMTGQRIGEILALRWKREIAQGEAVTSLDERLFPSVPKNAEGSRNTADDLRQLVDISK